MSLHEVIYYSDYCCHSELKRFIVMDCSTVDPTDYKSGNESRGVFEIYVSEHPINVFCDLNTDKGGWTVSI